MIGYPPVSDRFELLDSDVVATRNKKYPRQLQALCVRKPVATLPPNLYVEKQGELNGNTKI
jgi:hypothetical protein